MGGPWLLVLLGLLTLVWCLTRRGRKTGELKEVDGEFGKLVVSLAMRRRRCFGFCD